MYCRFYSHDVILGIYNKIRMKRMKRNILLGSPSCPGLNAKSLTTRPTVAPLNFVYTVKSLVSGHPRELEKVSVTRAVRQRELFPL